MFSTPVTSIPHACVGGETSLEPSWWAKDAQGIELCKVCDLCEAEKMARYRPEILSGYDQGDVDEEIESDGEGLFGSDDPGGDE
jgi:hypothetical protein